MKYKFGDFMQNKKTKVLLVTGFLGAGKTTVMKNLIKSFRS